jgi:flagellar biosynthesis protein FlhG
MHDQADELRQLVRLGAGRVRAPRWLTVCGGKGGVGTTTVSLGIAASLAHAGRRVVLIDGDFAGPDLASMTGVDPRYTVCDVLDSRRSVHESLESGPQGMQLLLGPTRDQRSVECSATAQERLIDQLRSLGPHADVVIVDAGAAVSRAMRRFWQAADDLVLVTTPDPLAVTDTYSALKQLYKREPHQAVHAVVNLGTDSLESAAVGDRFAETCRRFLALSLASVLSVASDQQLAGAAELSATDETLSRGLALGPFDRWAERWLAQRAEEQVKLAQSRDYCADDFSRDHSPASRCEV